eukprot:GFKZ01001425.1.p1 GENE.GFKZ01001425.1~~GFKZ01001425.1.p1  ORF type:complete len:362 (+),score=53.67 GFKZ01001425.1:122-1087(+)
MPTAGFMPSTAVPNFRRDRAFRSRCTTSRPNKITTAKMKLKTPNDLLIIGAGTLGQLIGTEWRTLHPDAEIVGVTGTDTSHAILRDKGITPVLAREVPAEVFPRVVFCAPPNFFKEDYPDAVEQGVKRVEEGGRMVFTSSGSVHGGEVVGITERTPVVSGGRPGLLAEAERVVLRKGEGIVVRLAGLYTLQRGAHSYWLRTGKVGGGEDGLLNLVWYGDAASAVVRALEGGDSVKRRESEEGRVYLVSAERPITRKEVCEVAMRHPMYADKQMPDFVLGQKERVDRVYDNSWTRTVLSWSPKFESFVDFMEEETNRALSSV